MHAGSSGLAVVTTVVGFGLDDGLCVAGVAAGGVDGESAGSGLVVGLSGFRVASATEDGGGVGRVETFVIGVIVTHAVALMPTRTRVASRAWALTDKTTPLILDAHCQR